MYSNKTYLLHSRAFSGPEIYLKDLLRADTHSVVLVFEKQVPFSLVPQYARQNGRIN